MENFNSDIHNLYITKSPMGFFELSLKRLIDIVGSLLGGVIALPVVLLFSLLVIIETPGKPLYRQKRLGKDGKEFYIYKIRSMYCDAEKNGAQWASENDLRITKIGSFIRKTRIDELPQLLNILVGDMSVVGPRPERKEFSDQFIKDIPNFNERLLVKPGLTGWAQVNGGYELSPDEKLKYDLEYILNQSIILDIKIMLSTVRVIITGEGAR